MDYNESLYIFLLSLLLCGFLKRWPLIWLAGITGLISATRPQGIAAAVAVGFHAWQRCADKHLPSRALHTLVCLTFAAWGLELYMLYQWAFHGNPFLFLERQKSWTLGWDMQRLKDLFTFRPVWQFLLIGKQSFPDCYPLFLVLNQGEWVVGVALLILGLYKRWLTAEEIIISAMTLGIAYVTEHARMQSIGRYSMLALPCFLVIARALAERTQIILLIAALLSAFVFLNAGMFAVWYCAC